MVAIIGYRMLSSSHATTPYASIDAASGSVTSPATIQNDSAAASGHDVQFGSASSPSDDALYNSSLPFNIIMIGDLSDQETNYAQLANSRTNLIYRTAIDYSDDSNYIQRWNSEGRRYLFTVAASDRVTGGLPLYDETNDTGTVISSVGAVGFYMHEVVTYNASVNGWDWTAAANSVDWSLINTWAMQAKAQNKKLVWSEPANGWQAINANPTAQADMAQWGNTLVPMFATNFNTATSDLVPVAEAGAIAAAETNQTSLGESVQSWYFRDDSEVPTEAATLTLAQLGLSAGATYYQIEGEADDLVWGTPYMNGIYAFSQKLGTTQTIPKP